MIHYMFNAEFVMLVSLKVPSGFRKFSSNAIVKKTFTDMFCLAFCIEPFWGIFFLVHLTLTRYGGREGGGGGVITDASERERYSAEGDKKKRRGDILDFEERSSGLRQR